MLKKIVPLCLALLLLLGLGIPTFAAGTGKPNESKPMHDKKSCVRVDVLEIAADVLGISENDVWEAVKPGKIGELLLAAGKLDAFKAAYLAEVKSELDEAVAEGKMTRSDADTRYAKAEEKIADYDGTTYLFGGKEYGKRDKKRD